MTIDHEWAESAFSFSWGVSTLTERLRALEDLVGSQADLVRSAGIEATAYKMSLKRGSAQPVERIGAIARATSVSLDYLVWGRPITARDGACEEKRFDLAARSAPLSSGRERQESLRLVIAQRRLEVEAQIAQLADAGMSEPFRVASYVTPPAGYVQVAPLMPVVVQSGRGSYVDDTHAPVAIAITWLDGRGHALSSLRYIGIGATEGGEEFPAGSAVLVDCSDVAIVPGRLYAMDIGGEAQLRRAVRRLGGAVELAHVNPVWPPEPLPDGDTAPILGTVIGAFCPR